ncbi:MAG TPA: hypothetical protein VMR81_06640 [Patescibacteria group bacterium]|jgi:hypothetical protein|nr:hypothetical protein [Patescibacteria group bacterium]
MDVEKIKEIVRRKPMFLILLSIGYLLLVSVLKWTVHPILGTLLFIVGGLIGVYFLDIAEVFFHLNPSPFRSILFEAAFIVVSLFVVTSSGSMITNGLVLSIYLAMILWQVGEWQVQKNLNSWYRLVAGAVSVQIQRSILIGFVILFIIETYFFIR